MTESTQIIESEQNPDKLPKRKRKIDIAEALKLRLDKGWSYQMLAERYNVHKSAVHAGLKRFVKIIDSPVLSEAYKENRVGLLNSIEYKILDNLVDDDRLKKASVNNLAYAFNQVHSARRLESGQSTANIGVSVESRLNKALEQAGSTDDVV